MSELLKKGFSRYTYYLKNHPLKTKMPETALTFALSDAFV